MNLDNVISIPKKPRTRTPRGALAEVVTLRPVLPVEPRTDIDPDTALTLQAIAALWSDAMSFAHLPRAAIEGARAVLAAMTRLATAQACGG